MTVSKQIAKHFREIYFGGNWSSSDLKHHLSDLSWKLANKQVYNFNSISTLTHHSTYYVNVLIRVLQGEPLRANDEESFIYPPVHSQQDWDRILEQLWANAEKAAQLIEKVPDKKLNAPFTDEKYGTYYRNICGIIEHLHYHLGQIVVIKKILLHKEKLQGG